MKILNTLPAQMHHSYLRPKFFKPAKNNDDHRWMKPDRKTSLWTSTYEPKADPEYGQTYSGWHEWCVIEKFRLGKMRWGHIYQVAPDLRIIEIDSLADLKELLAEFTDPRPMYPGDKRLQPDFEAIARAGYHAIHLTNAGQWATRMTEPNLYGWDCESTCWLRLPKRALSHIDKINIGGYMPTRLESKWEAQSNHLIFTKHMKDFMKIDSYPRFGLLGDLVNAETTA